MPTIQCNSCDTSFRYNDNLAGKKVSCPTCKAIVHIPGARDFDLPVTSDVQPVVKLVPIPPLSRQEAPTGQTPETPQPRLLSPWPPLALGWLAGLAALPLAVALGRPGTGIWLAVAGLLFSALAVLLSLLRGNQRLASFVALCTAASSLFVSTTMPRAQAAPSGTDEAIGSWVLPDARKYPSIGSVLSAYPGHIVVLTAEVSIPEDAEALLRQMFGDDRVILLRRDQQQRDGLLKAQLDRSVASPKNLDQLDTLLDAFAEKNVRFKGYQRGNPKLALEGIIRRGGIFTISTGTGTADQRHGSLLHSRGIDQILSHTGLDSPDYRSRMLELRDAVRDYASLNDVLAIVGNRLAFLISVEPNAVDHDAAIKKLLDHSGNPVFVPRPPPRLFDAVDPTEGGGGGDSSFELRLPRKYYFRQVGKDDRTGIDLEKGLPTQRLKWREFPKDEVARWEVLSVRKKGRSVPVSSFDVAVQLPDRVVVFRNQNLFFDISQEKIEREAKSYAETFGISVPVAEDIVKVQRGKGGRFVGSLLYNTLANRIVEADRSGSGDIEVLKSDAFTALMKRENDF